MCDFDLQSCSSSSAVAMVLVPPHATARDAEPWIIGGLLVICAAVVLYGIRRSIRQTKLIAAMAPEDQADLVSRDAW